MLLSYEAIFARGNLHFISELLQSTRRNHGRSQSNHVIFVFSHFAHHCVSGQTDEPAITVVLINFSHFSSDKIDSCFFVPPVEVLITLSSSPNIHIVNGSVYSQHLLKHKSLLQRIHATYTAAVGNIV